MKNLKNNYTHRLAMIQDELKALRKFIQSNNELESKFHEPSFYSNNGAITHLNNIEIACSLEDSECLHWKPYTSKPKEKKIFEVDVTRISYGNRLIEVEAETQEEAEAIALELALDEVFDDYDADYNVHTSTEINN
jgi:hypothetical protein